MKRSLKFASFALLVVVSDAAVSHAQVAIGTPPFSSFGGGPFDAVNLGNLNVHFVIPIVQKAGRGLPFNYNLTYDSSIWQPVTSGSTKSWTRITNNDWGWTGLIGTGGQIFKNTTVDQEPCFVGTLQKTETTTTTSFVTYLDWTGTAHRFIGIATHKTGCTFQDTGFGPKAALDGSGYQITVDGSGDVTLLTDRSGSVINAVVGSFSTTDANGNEITSTPSAFTDTLGTTVLTTAGSGTPSSPMTFSYTSPSGAAASYTVHFTSYTVKTNFLVSGISEYGPTANSLVSSIQLPDGTSYAFTYEQTPGTCTIIPGTFSNCITGRIASVTLPTGGVISYAYTGPNDGINGTDGSTMFMQRTLSPGGVWQYSRSGSGSAWTTTVTDPASNQTAISFETSSNNFYETQRLAYAGSSSTTACSSTVTTNCLLSTTINCYNGQSVATPASCFNTAITAQVTRITNFRYLPNSSGIAAETDSTYDTFGLIHEVDEYDYGTPGSGVGSLIRKTVTAYQGGMTNGIVDRPSSVTIEDSGNNVKAATSYLYDEGTLATPTGTTPQHGSITGSRGNLTTVNAQVNGTTHLYRHYTYFNTGMLATSTDVSTSSTTNGATTTYNYNSAGNADCGNAFVTSISEPVSSMSRSFTWDCNGGVLLSVTDENGNISSTAYSGTNYTNVFWRPYSTTDEAGNTTNYFYRLNTATPPIEFQSESTSATFNTGHSVVDKVTTTDGFGRMTFSQTLQGPGSTTYDTVATCYDNFGRANFTSTPYSTTLATSSTACPSTNPGTTTTFDALGRTSQITDAGNGSGHGTTTFTYNENDTLEARSSPSISKQSEFDGLGRLKSVCEVNSGTTAWPSASCSQNTGATGYLTTYAYDLLGNLTSVAQNAQASTGHQSRTYVYDMLSRLTSETNPETANTATTYSYDSLSADSSCGTITSAGNLLKTLDGAGNAACYSGYDALHRVGSVIYPSSSTPSKNFVYDAATVNGTPMSNAKTRLAEAYTCIGGCSGKTTDLGFSYTATGQQSDVWELTPHSGTNFYYHVTATQWPNGAINTLSNLVGLPTITYGTDGEGRMLTVSGTGNLVTSVSYDPASHVTGITYGSSDSDSFTYDSVGRMHTYTYSMGATPKTDSGTLNWNTNGTLLSLTITDQINSANTQTCNYTHDGLSRIASANCGTAVFNQAFSYDPFGNITKTVPSGSTGTAFQPGYDTTTNRMNTTPFTYSGNNGGLTNDSSHAYGWDNATRLSTVDSGGSNGICITYDALDRVVEQATGSSCPLSPTNTKEIVYTPAGAKLAIMNGSALLNAFISLPSGAQAVYNASGLLFYRHPDWLGSSRLATTPSRTCYWDIAYAPFGENYKPPASGCVAQDLNFTGQNQDTIQSVSTGGQGGLFDFMFRKHSPVQGRWLSPDPAGIASANPSDPQTWNRYAYAANRPLSAVDALGLDPIEPFQPGCDPEDPFDCSVCEPDLDPFCLPGPIGPEPLPFPPEGPSSPVFSPPVFSGGSFRSGGVWPDNETLGLPGNLNGIPLDAQSIFGLIPNMGCGDIGSTPGFVQVPTESNRPKPCLSLIISFTISTLFSANNGSGEKPKPQVPKGGGVGYCTLVPPMAFKRFGGCTYVCEYVYDDPFDIRIGGAHASGPQIDHACPEFVKTPFCPRHIIVEKDHPGALENGKILSCSP